jgi:hypothetical protein
MAFNNIYLALKGTVKSESAKAVLFIYPIGDNLTKEEWFPKSQLARVIPGKQDGSDVIMASEWILKQKDALQYATKAAPPLSSEPTMLAHPSVPTTPPAKSFVDMDDDIPF